MVLPPFSHHPCQTWRVIARHCGLFLFAKSSVTDPADILVAATFHNVDVSRQNLGQVLPINCVPKAQEGPNSHGGGFGTEVVQTRIKV